MARFASLPLFTDAYLADTGHLSDAEHGRYLLMLMTMWRVPGCRLPNDDQWLARHFRRSVEEVQTELRPIISEFMQNDGNWITQKRLCKEFRFVTIAHEKRSVAAKSREYNKKTEHNAYAPTPTPTPTVRKKEGANAPRARGPQRKPETEFPEYWKLSDQERQCAVDLHWPADRIAHEFQRFRNHADQNDRRCRNWPAAWRNWVISPHQQKANQPGRPQVMSLKDRKTEDWNDARAELKRSIDQDREGKASGQPTLRLLPRATGE